MKWKIGEIKQVNSEWYQCVVAMQGCRGCSFRTQDYCTHRSECMSTERSDRTSVIFKKLEKVGEPFERNGYMYQEYKAHTYPLLMNGGAIIPTDNGFAVMIKQNKEDMEEKKLNLKPFDIQKAREGKPVCTRDGRKARIICFDRRDTDNHCIVALIEDKELPNKEGVRSYFDNGKYLSNNEESVHDLMMLPEKKEGWVNLYKSSVHSTKEEAMKYRNKCDDYIDTIKISWEE